MKKYGLFLLAAALICSAAYSNAAEKKVKIKTKNIPQAITANFKSVYPEGKILKTTARKNDNGNIQYKIRSINGKVKRAIRYTEDGTVTCIEDEINPAVLPDPVKENIAKMYPGSRIIKTEKVTENNATSYEIVIKSPKNKKGIILVTEKKNRINMDETGKILQKENNK